jgi:hypothetical protein
MYVEYEKSIQNRGWGKYSEEITLEDIGLKGFSY